MARCKIFSVEKTELTFEDGRTNKGYTITFGGLSNKTDGDGKRIVDGYVPFCYSGKDGKARCDKYVAEKKVFPEGYAPKAGDMVDIEFELGTSSIVSVTKATA